MSIIDFQLNDINGSVQDDLWCAAISDNSGQTDFKYVFDIYNNDKQLIRVKVYPNPNGWGYFNCGSVVRNEMSYDWFDPESSNAYPIFLPNPNASGQISIDYQVRIGEDVSGVTTLNMASGQSTVYNITSPLFKRNRPYYNPLEFNSTNTKNWKYLTNRPKKNIKCRLDGNLIIPFKIPYQSITNFGFQIEAYNANDQFQFKFNTYDDYPIFSISINEFYQINIIFNKY